MPLLLPARLQAVDLDEPHPLVFRFSDKNDFAAQLRRLAPFGAGNPEPVFACEEMEALEVRTLPDRRAGGPGHLKLRLAAPAAPGWSPRVSDAPAGAPLDAIAFGMGGSPIARGARVRAAFQIGLDRYFGADRVQLKLKDLTT